jgi:hypothetical protein
MHISAPKRWTVGLNKKIFSLVLIGTAFMTWDTCRWDAVSIKNLSWHQFFAVESEASFLNICKTSLEVTDKWQKL